MNETLRSILNRRSNRAFLAEQIKEEELKTIIEAGIYAPSAHNQQSWHFTVVQDKQLLDQLSDDAKVAAKHFDDKLIQQLANNEKFHAFYNAPTAIIVSGEEKAMMPEVSCAAATENMLIAAESIGVGSCWVAFVGFAFGGEKGKDYLKRLGIPEGYKPSHAVALGYKKIEHAKAPARRENTVNYVK
ncbi:MAG: nitroreductase family protein [Dissulfurispiraceae bacterium]